MGKSDLPKPTEGKMNGFHWIRRAKDAGMKHSKKFSFIEGKRVLKMLEDKGLKALALEVAPDGGFRFEVAPLSGPASETTVNPWDEVL
ncbi:hypothetical protein DFO80_1033 [Rhodobacter sp. 140A]|nr:hypothetical protein DFO80_1033 [Rhodobacter sp. 140A]